MLFNLYSVKDKTSGVFLQPFVARSDVDATRQLAAAFEDPAFMQTPAGRYPQDFVLYGIGTFDDVDGDVGSNGPRSIATLSDLRPSPPSTVRS